MLHAHEELVGNHFYTVDLLDDVDRLYVKINRVVRITLLGI